MLPYKVPSARCDRVGPDFSYFIGGRSTVQFTSKNFEEMLKGQLFKRS